MIPGHHHGCLLCGAALEYRDAAAPVACALCGAAGASPVSCLGGHFVCDACHAAPARDVIERACLASQGTDPVALATRFMRHPSLKLHGPEHHFLTGIRVARQALGVRLTGHGPACEWSDVNAECLDEACPFHPDRGGGPARA